MELYFEALCPYCHAFINGGLTDASKMDGIENMLDLKLIPYGNARELATPEGEYTYTCQHGPAECDGNRMLVRGEHMNY